MSEAAISYARKYPDLVLALKRHIGRLPTASTAAVPEQRIAQFIATCGALREMEQLHSAFNLFEGLGVQEAEVRHSRLLAWLLDPAASHGQGAFYLTRFLGLTCHGNPAQTTPTPSTEPAEDWQVSCEDDRIDILIKNPRRRFLCAVETKVHATQGADQLSRYRELLARRYPDYERQLVYLTLGQECPGDPAWQPLSLRRMVREVIPDGDVLGGAESLRPLLFGEYAEWIKAKAQPGPGNLLPIMHLARHELRHSNFLAWLLNPRASHGLGDAFVRYFFALLTARTGRPLSKLLDGCSDLQVEWEHEHLDLLLLSERCRLAVIVENKVHAVLRQQQLADYERFVAREFGSDHTVVVYLDMQGRPSGHPNAVDLSYQDLWPFFAERSAGPAVSESDRIATLIDQYRKLLSTKLWTRAKTLRLPPPKLDELAARVAREHRGVTVAMLGQIRDWREETSTTLGEFLVGAAKEIFGWEVQRHWPWASALHYYTFVPSCLDAMPLLRHSGKGGGYDGRLIVYEFYVNLFAGKYEGRPAQLSLDVKIHDAKAEAARLKQHLHDLAAQTNLFHRAGNLKTPRKHDILLNHRLLEPEEIEFRSLDEIQEVLRRRLQRFAETTHAEIARFLHSALASYQADA